MSWSSPAALGHTRPMCGFFACLVQARSDKLLVSFMTTPSVIGQAKAEIAGLFDVRTAGLEDAIRPVVPPVYWSRK
ncbi:hypothetical protein B0H17DRAFT_1215295 [Mycena rosella]|uniref:Uncharacterized protein n=1 Tax=Mycena rosella TaxID=1033263 RepID=A0AAD7FXV7_MYCRO|nr:hypothetical protein B0H17DRAFT_1215295 [Mycena rosella]